MTIALLLLVPASAASDLLPPIPTATGPVAAVTTYDAFVATEETPPTKDLLHPAVLIEERVPTSIGNAQRSRWIA